MSRPDFDLHLHTTASDGTDTPTELISLAAREGFKTVAVTDHDTMHGLNEAMIAGARQGVAVIPGVEISAGGSNEVHILGYGALGGGRIEYELDRMRLLRDGRMDEMVSRLGAIGIDIDISEVEAKSDGAIGRPHLARVLVERGVARDVKDAFAKYLSPGRPAYVPREKLGIEAAIDLITSAGGLAVIAHPGQYRADFFDEDFIRAAAEKGLGGLEAYHPSHSARQCADFDRLARELRLVVTGGSDYHGPGGTVLIGDGLSRWRRASEDFEIFLDALEKCAEE